MRRAIAPDAAGRLARPIACAVLGAAAIVLSAKVQIPFWPVPATLQSLVVLLIGSAFGPWLGMATVLLYLAAGLAGLPVFAGASAGPAYMAGPTGGYLIGFACAAGLAGWLAERGWARAFPRALLLMALGHAALFVPGVLRLAMLFGWPKAVAVGIAPFLLALAVKTVLGAALLVAAAPRIGGRR